MQYGTGQAPTTSATGHIEDSEKLVTDTEKAVYAHEQGRPADLAAMKCLFQQPSVWKGMCFFGVLPIANLLSVMLLPWLRRKPYRAGLVGFRIGFEVVGCWR
jgi:hypothetical protein